MVIALNRILVPTDFSTASDAAVQYGIALAEAFHASLCLLHVAVRHELQIIVERQLVIDRFLNEPATTGHHNVARELFSNVLTSDQERGLRAEYVVRASGVGGPYAEIVRYAKERSVDLIVMGTHGRGFMTHMLMGSVAEKVVRRSPCPVLTVRNPEHEFVTP